MQDWTKRSKGKDELEATSAQWTQAPQNEANQGTQTQQTEAKEPSWSGEQRVSRQGLANAYEAGHVANINEANLKYGSTELEPQQETPDKASPEKSDSPSQSQENEIAETATETQTQSTQQIEYELER